MRRVPCWWQTTSPSLLFGGEQTEVASQAAAKPSRGAKDAARRLADALAILTSGSDSSWNSKWDDMFKFTIIQMTFSQFTLDGSHPARLHGTRATFVLVTPTIIFHWRDVTFSSADSTPGTTCSLNNRDHFGQSTSLCSLSVSESHLHSSILHDSRLQSLCSGVQLVTC